MADKLEIELGLRLWPKGEFRKFTPGHGSQTFRQRLLRNWVEQVGPGAHRGTT